MVLTAWPSGWRTHYSRLAAEETFLTRLADKFKTRSIARPLRQLERESRQMRGVHGRAAWTSQTAKLQLFKSPCADGRVGLNAERLGSIFSAFPRGVTERWLFVAASSDIAGRFPWEDKLGRQACSWAHLDLRVSCPVSARGAHCGLTTEHLPGMGAVRKRGRLELECFVLSKEQHQRLSFSHCWTTTPLRRVPLRPPPDATPTPRPMVPASSSEEEHESS
jgi:hypothetical protein